MFRVPLALAETASLPSSAVDVAATGAQAIRFGLRSGKASAQGIAVINLATRNTKQMPATHGTMPDRAEKRKDSASMLARYARHERRRRQRGTFAVPSETASNT
jgi:hypothetical protein